MANDTMKIITYNLGLLDLYICRKKIFEFAPYTRSRALIAAETLAKLEADVICLQELFHPVDRDRILNALKKVYPYSAYPRIKQSRFNKKLSSGLLTISKHPIHDIQHTVCANQMMDEKLIAPKGYLITEMSIGNNNIIQIINIHTTGGGMFFHPESKLSDKTRLLQIQEALGNCDQKLAIVLCGDLNCGPDVSMPVFLEVASTLQLDYKLPANFHVTWDPKNPLNQNSPHSSSPPQFIDHIIPNDIFFEKYVLTESGIEPMSMDFIKHEKHTLSDHYAFYKKFDLNNKSLC